MKKYIKKLLPTSIINIFKNILPSNKTRLIKKLKFNKIDNISYLGSNYGGWSYKNSINIKNKFIISAGLGEDASFDIELISKHNCKVIAVDPTPRAITHYNKIIKSIGKKKKVEYDKEGGGQNISSYDLTNINNNNFILIPCALYNVDNKELKFFAPPDKNHVSYSINNWQNDYKKTSDFLKVKTISVKSILDKFNIENLEMIKLDIEGAAIEVILNMLKHKIFPKQILVEFDELNKINNISLNRFFDVHYKILSNDYELVKTSSKFPDFLYIRSY
jgi:FkbM family methyltransferase